MARIPFEKFVKKYGTATAILLGAVIIGAAILVSSGRVEWGRGDKSGQKPQGEGRASVIRGERQEVSADDDPALGEANAAVTMIEFSDFQCPFCRSFWRETLPLIKQNYIDKGLVRFVYRDFPIDSLHPAARSAAEAAECARDQGKFWEYHDRIFAGQDEEGRGTIQFGLAELETWARDLRLDAEEFKSCLDSRKYREEVEKDLSDGTAAGVTGTPSFFINGRPVEGALPFEKFQPVIEQELATKK